MDEKNYPPKGTFYMYPQYRENNELFGFTTEYEGKGAFGRYCQIIATGKTLQETKSEDEISNAYIDVFSKKFPVLPTLKGEQLDKFKNFLNRCKQVLGLQEFGMHPKQAELFDKLALLWAAWGADNLQGVGQYDNGEQDNEVISDEPLSPSEGWREEIQALIDHCHIMSGYEGHYKEGVKDALKVFEDHI